MYGDDNANYTGYSSSDFVTGRMLDSHTDQETDEFDNQNFDASFEELEIQEPYIGLDLLEEFTVGISAQIRANMAAFQDEDE